MYIVFKHDCILIVCTYTYMYSYDPSFIADLVHFPTLISIL